MGAKIECQYLGLLKCNNEEFSVLTLEDAAEQIKQELKKHGKLKGFCERHNLCYGSVVALKNKEKAKRYPNLIQNLLEILFPIETESIQLLKIKNIKKE